MSFIGEAVLSASVELLIEKLASQGLELFTQHKKLKTGFMRWKGMLEMIQAVLIDAEDRRTKDDKPVKKWLHNLQNLDECETEALRRELLLQEPAAVECLVAYYLLHCINVEFYPSAASISIRLDQMNLEPSDLKFVFADNMG